MLLPGSLAEGIGKYFCQHVYRGKAMCASIQDVPWPGELLCMSSLVADFVLHL